MTAKDFLNVKKPHFWTALAVIVVLGLAGVVSILDKEKPTEQVDVPPTEVIEVEVEKGFALSGQTESITIGDTWAQ